MIRAKKSESARIAPGMWCSISIMIALGLAITTLYACSAGPALSADQSRGKRIYEALCDKCHKLIPPQSRADHEWTAAAERYGVKLKLQPNEVTLLKVYLNRANDADFR